MSEPNPGFPLHRFNTGQTKAWVGFPNTRGSVASILSKKYRGTGVGLLSATMCLFVIVEPTGRFRLLKPPWKRFDMWQVANAPHYLTECACRHFFDPEVEGNWSGRDGKLGHHPFCQFSNTAMRVHKKCHTEAVIRVAQKLPPQPRPDTWVKAMENAKS